MKKRQGPKQFFIKTVHHFMLEMGLYPKSQRAFVAVSGGIDSMVLLFTLTQLKKYYPEFFSSLTVLHINHGTRQQNFDEEKMVKATAERYQIDCIVHHLEKNSLIHNFEMEARKARYTFFQTHLAPGDLLYTAHHLDDSFEWSLLQSLRSGSLKGMLGIPVKNRQVARPFLCVTKKQLALYAKKNHLPFLEDHSNFDTQFERNYIRQKMIPLIERRHPNYLKHYVYRSNLLAHKLNCSLQTNVKSRALFFQNPLGIKGIYWPCKGKKSFFAFEEELLQMIHSLSLQKRGVIRDQLKQLIVAQQKGKWGPLTFSGGVFGWMLPDMVGFTSESGYKELLLYDAKILKRLQEIDMDKIKEYTFNEVQLLIENNIKRGDHFPFLLFSPDKKKMEKYIPSLKKRHPLLPQTGNWPLQNGWWFHFSSLFLKIVSKKKLAKEITFRLLLC